jgi:hypothetical protein
VRSRWAILWGTTAKETDLNALKTMSLAAAVLVGLAGTATTQDGAPASRRRPPPPSQEDLVAKRAEKLAKDFLKKADWITDYDQARAAAKKSDKLIFAYFTRSYAR